MGSTPKKVDIPAELRPLIESTAKNLLRHLYGPDGPAWGTTFIDMEELVVQLSRSIGTELLQQALRRQAEQPPPEQLHNCPLCSRTLQPTPPEPRCVQTRTGTVDWQEPSFYCGRCRKSFFPSVQEPGH